jgi:hypothetical protein
VQAGRGAVPMGEPWLLLEGESGEGEGQRRWEAWRRDPRWNERGPSIGFKILI